jgi:thiosulfate/3-mercaptopyruvate sulfurtransferase
MDRRDLFISPDELMGRLGEDGLAVVDGSWYLDKGRDPHAEYLDAHVLGAVFFDVDGIAEPETDLPHMLPPAGLFAERVGALGIAHTDEIVVYDGEGLFSAPRVWWTFRTMGARRVRILDGGLPGWRAAGGPLESGAVTHERRIFDASLAPDAVAGLADMQAVVTGQSRTILDARPPGRFAGREPEPRPGLRSGHMPGAHNLPAGRLVRDGRLVPNDEIRALLAEAGVEGGPFVTTCGSGVTAALLLLALAAIGEDDVRLYDGSWAEWGGRQDTEIVTSA